MVPSAKGAAKGMLMAMHVAKAGAQAALSCDDGRRQDGKRCGVILVDMLA